MTVRKHLKQLVRARMQKTGESYTTARRHVIAKVRKSMPIRRCAGTSPAMSRRRPPCACCSLMPDCTIRTPAPFSEAMLFGLAGGVGIGVFSFFYEKQNFASFFLAGRHLWHDHLAYLRGACERLGLAVEVRECSGVKPAERHLRELLERGPCIAWVDGHRLPHRAFPADCSWSTYHVITVYRLDGDTALIGDLTDEPISVPLAALTEARGASRRTSTVCYR